MNKALGQTPKRANNGRKGLSRAQQRLARAREAGQEHPVRWRERLGETEQARPKGSLVWIHAETTDKALEFLPLIERMWQDRDDFSFLITTNEFNLANPLEGRLPVMCLHQFLPYKDGAGYERFLTHWLPDICIWSGDDMKNQLFDKMASRDIPMIMVNASMADDQLHKLRWFPGAARHNFGQFSHILAVDGRSARNLKKLGIAADRIEVLGHLHEGPPPLDCVPQERDAMAETLAARPIWLATGVVEGEEATVLSAHKHVSRRSHRLLLILVPADFSRGAVLAEKLEAEGWFVALRSAGQDPDPEVQIYIADLEGELGLWFRLAPVSFIGGTLSNDADLEGDPYQAAALGSAVLHGPNLGNYSMNYARLQAAGAARKIDDKRTLSGELEYLLTPDKAAEMARAAWEVTTSGAEVSDRIVSLISEVLDAKGL